MWINHRYKLSFIFVIDLNSLSFISEEQKARVGERAAFKREGSKSSQSIYSWKIGLKATEGEFVTATGPEKRPDINSLKVVTTKPAVIRELEKYFEKPQITVQCLVELSKGNDPEGDFRDLIPFRERSHTSNF